MTRRASLHIAASAALALTVALLPWYALDDHVPNGWDATWWARLAALAAVAGIAAARLGAPARLRTALAAVAVAAVALRVAVPPDFGFDFGGLDVPTERRAGCWAALTAALLSLAAAPGPRAPRRADAAAGGPEPGPARA